MKMDRKIQRKSAGREGLPFRRWAALLGSILFLACVALPIAAEGGATAPDPTLPPALQGIGIDQRLGEALDLDLVFRDETGRTVRLADYFGRGPVILTLNYYECPMLCTLELNGLVAALKTISLEPGRDFEIVTVSINPKETPDLAAEKKAHYVKDYGRPGGAAGWHFLTGEEREIRALAEAVGFRYAFDAESGQYAHAAGIVVTTPGGRLSRYFYGVDFPPRDLRLGLVESSEGKIGSLADRILLFCYHYDPATGRYGAAALTLMRAGGILTVLALGLGVALLLRKGRAAARDNLETVHRAI
jgi:protein SCO1/2